MADGTLYGTLTTNTVSGKITPGNALFGGLTVDKLEGTLTVPSSIEMVKDYEKLTNKPSIETVELIGNKSFKDLGLEALSNSDLMELLTL